MGALDCVTSSKMQPTESTEVFTINMSSNSTLNEPRRDLESQATESRKHSRLWTVFVDLPLVLIVLALVGLFELGVIPSYQGGFYCNDPALSFPFTGDTVSSGVLVATIFIAPLIVILGTELIFYDLQYSFWEKTKAVTKKTLWIYRNYIYGLIFNFALVEVMKGITGSPRPTFLYLCEPDANCTGSDRYISSFQCTSTKFSRWMQKDSYHSFPSGHTSLSVHCALFIFWYLQRRAFDWRSRTVFVVPTVQLAAITFAAVSSLTRITDHRHHWWDVAVGFFVGLATFFYAAIVLSKRGAVISRSSSDCGVQQSVKTLIFDPRTIEPVSP